MKPNLTPLARPKKKGFCSLDSIKQTFEFVIEVFETILRKLSDRARSARKWSTHWKKFGIDKQPHTLSSPVKSNGIFFSTVRNSAYEWHMWLAWLYTILQHYSFFSFVVEHVFWLNNSPVNCHYESQKYMNHDSLKMWLSSIFLSPKIQNFLYYQKAKTYQ